jgi:nucleoside-diphosphate-sugar epimerase
VRTLVLGGTVFLGRHVAAEALARGHELTLFTRGRHGADLFPEATHLRGDRAGDLTALEQGEWDIVVDTSGRRSADVAASARLLADRAGHYVFVSSVNAHPDWPERPVDEESSTWQTGDDDYGAQKAAAERAAEAAMPGRVAAVRAGCIAGPHDNVFRLPWWVRRIAAGGDVLAPGDPAQPVQLVDARDLAAWMLDLGERRVGGAFCATAPAGPTTMGDVMEAAVRATGSGARLVWAPDALLAESGLEPWVQVPLWLPAAEFPGTWRIGTARAEAAGLRFRPIAETVADVWAWLRDGGADELGEWGAENRATGIPPVRERELLARLGSGGRPSPS